MKIVQLSANWCVPCKRIKPVAEKYAKTINKEYEYIDINDENNFHWIEFAKENNIRTVPTFVLVDHFKGILFIGEFTELKKQIKQLDVRS